MSCKSSSAFVRDGDTFKADTLVVCIEPAGRAVPELRTALPIA
jgi:hypothetical protein